LPARSAPAASRPSGKLPATAGEMLQMARAFLERKEVAEARLEAELLVAHALELDRLGLFMRLDQPVQPREVDRARDLLVRRGRREPVAYIIGKREFYGRDFEVGPGVLIPRPETELLVDFGREACASPGARVLDYGTGSGCIAVTLALELEDAHVIAVDASPEALTFARRNAERLNAHVTFVEASTPNNLGSEPFDLIVSNPPYVEPQTASELAPEVRDFEPDAALFAPAGDPDYWARTLLEFAQAALTPNGELLLELGLGQAPRVRALAQQAGWNATVESDLAGIERVLRVRNDGNA